MKDFNELQGAGNAVGGVLYDYMSYNSIMTVFGLSLIFHGVINTVFVLSARNKVNVGNSFTVTVTIGICSNITVTIRV